MGYVQSFPKPMTSEEEKACLKQYVAGDVHAKDQLIERNLRLVAHIVKKYHMPGRDMEELISVGIVGLVKAVNTFEVDKGHKIVTYAARCIENEILMLLRSERRQAREVSLYDPIGTDKEGNEINLLDIIEGEETDVVEQMVLSGNTKRLYQLVESCLPEREKQVLCLRYGLYQQEPVTQREIAGRLGISRSYVSRIEKRALGKLRAEFEKNQ